MIRFQNVKSILTALLLFAGILVSVLPAQADWRKDIGIFRIGIITTDQSLAGLDKIAPFKLALSEALDIPVEFYRARNTLALIDAMASDRIEYAIMPTSGYALAWSACQCVEPIAVPRYIDSSDGYHTIIIARKDGPGKISDLVGRKIGVFSSDSITGSALAAHALAQEGIIIGDEKTPFVTMSSGAEMLRAFSNGEVAALVGWSSMTGNPSQGYSRGNLRQLFEQYGLGSNAVSVLWKSDQIPHRPHVIRKRLHGEAKQILRNTLLAMGSQDPIAYDTIEKEFGGGFSAGRHDRFLQIIELIDAQIQNDKTAEQETVPLQ